MSGRVDFSLLKRFFMISPEGADSPTWTMSAADLVRDGAMQEALRICGQPYRAIGQYLPASFIGLSVYGLSAAQLMILVQTGRWIDLSLSNLTFEAAAHEGYAQIGYRIHDVRLSDVPEGNARNTYLNEAWIAFHRNTVIPLIESVTRQAGVKPQLVWNQYPSRHAFLRDCIREQETSRDVLTRFEQEDGLLCSLPAGLFRLRRNPYIHQPKYIPSPYAEGERMMIRSACCMYYKREQGTKCFNCPILSERDREAMRRSMLKA
jgi:ferric iron reductase protein FhuF